MISDINGITSVEEESLYTAKKEEALGRDDFLKLFLAQLNNQDPLNPMDGTEFSAQLAQFSSLEQLFNVNENLESMKTLQDNSSRFQALELIGKDIEAEGDTLSLVNGIPTTGSFTLEEAADCTGLINDADGYPVREISLGSLEKGEQSFEWDGRDWEGNPINDGVYSFEITALSQTGVSVPVETKVRGTVSRVNFEGDQPVLYIGEMPVYMSQVIDVDLMDTKTDG